MAFDSVLPRDVRDFVSQYAGELRLALDETKRAARDVDDATRRGERIHTVGVEHDELPLQVGTAAHLRHHGADERDVFGHLFVLQHAELETHAVADRFTKRAFILLRDFQIS